MRKIFSILLCSAVVFFNLSLISCEKRDSLSINNSEKEKKIAFPQEKNNLVELNIYFDSTKKDDTVELSKEQRIIKKDELLAETIINELIKGPSVKSNLSPVFDKNAKLISVSIKDNIAYVNLSKDTNQKMTAKKEEACIKSIVLSLTQLSSVNRVKIFVDNNDTNLFGNNFDLSKPIGREDLKNIKSN
ncbi:GerMN domain-containing protein [Clostridium sp. LBM24168]